MRLSQVKRDLVNVKCVKRDLVNVKCDLPETSMRLSQVWDARESTNVRAYTYMCAREQVQTLSARGPFSRSCPWPRQWVVSTLCSSPHCARCLPFWRALLPRSLQPLRHRDCDTAPQQPIHNTLCAQCMLRRQACEAQLVSPQRQAAV